MLRTFPTLLALALLAACGDPEDTDKTADTQDTEETGDPTDAPDRDGDGYTSDVDCDDYDPAVHPDAFDGCNGVDDDCDGDEDEDPDIPWYLDSDGDGFGDPGAEIDPSCEPTDGYVSNRYDCDDEDAEVYPGATEICDGVDNNCDGDADEGAALYVEAGAPAGGNGTADDPFSSIQDAIDEGEACVEVGPGTYFENLSVFEGPIYVYSQDGADNTTIDGQALGPVIEVETGTEDLVGFVGFTLTNGADSVGAGLLVSDSTLELSDLQVIENSASSSGGGAYFEYANVSLHECLFSGNWAYDGGGVYINGGTVKFVGTTLTNNEAYYGGGLAAYGGTIDMAGSAIDGNIAWYSGGGAYVYYSDELVLSDVDVTNNEAYYDPGAGLYLYYLSSSVPAQLNDVRVVGNSSTYSSAAGLYLGYYSYVEATNLSLTGNLAESSTGGGFLVEYGSTLDVTGADISDNGAYSFAAGSVDESFVYLNQASIRANEAQYVGGLGVRDYSYVELINTVMHSNVDDSGSSGSGYYGAALNVYNYSTLVANHLNLVNTQGTYALRIYSSSSFYLANSIVAYNSGYGLNLSSVPESYMDGGYNAFWDNTYGNLYYPDGSEDILEGETSLNEDPLFVSYDADPDSDDLHLDASSPCVDAGDPHETDANGSASDMGAYGGPGGEW